MSGRKLIKLSLINGKAMTFNAEDYMTLRAEHRIVGRLLGVPVIQQRNLVCHALPAFYNEYETKLLLEEGIAELSEKTNLKMSPDDSTKEAYGNHLKNVEKELSEPYVESRLQKTRLRMDEIIKGKTKKLLKSGVSQDEIKINPEDILKEEALRIQQSISSESVYVQIPTQCPFSTTSSSSTDFSVKNPRKYKVFKDLWNKGFHITTGDSFGGDFLTYPADPMYFHASQVVHIVDDHQSYDVKYLISCSRLSVSVNKKCLFAYVNEDDTVTYQSLSWDNPKLRQLYPPRSASAKADENEIEESAVDFDNDISLESLT